MNQLGIKIKALRKKRGLTQEQLGTIVGVDGSMINKIEKGKSSGSMQTLERIATALGKTLAQLLKERATTEREAV